MFTGIVTALGTVRAITPLGGGADMRLTIAAPWPDTASIAIGASIGCSGCCLTAVEIGPDWFAADASAETLSRTTLGRWQHGHAGQSGTFACVWATNSAAISSPAMSMASARCCRRRRNTVRPASCSACPPDSRASSR